MQYCVVDVLFAVDVKNLTQELKLNDVTRRVYVKHG